MHTLLLRLAGIMQSWGTDSRFNIRASDLEPSKSGVIGLCCAALGWPRIKDVSQLAALCMGVRIDNQGALKNDYQTTINTIRASGNKNPDAVTSTRYYISGGSFLVGLSGSDLDFLKSLHNALENPHWQLYLGRKGYVPSEPIYLPDGLKINKTLKESLAEYPFKFSTNEEKAEISKKVPIIIEVSPNQGYQFRNDQPIGTAYNNRSFKMRELITEYIEVKSPKSLVENQNNSE
jgi:CRISPR system Cascade subunit CasD